MDENGNGKTNPEPLSAAVGVRIEERKNGETEQHQFEHQSQWPRRRHKSFSARMVSRGSEDPPERHRNQSATCR